MTTFCTELSGILATLYFINALQGYTKENILAQLPLYYDNMAAVLTTKTSMLPGITSHLCPSYDVSTELRSELQRVPNLIISWVKAHQDKKKPFHDLPLDTQLNCIADKDTEKFCKTAPPELQPTEVPLELLLNKAYMIVNGTV
eukprot:1202547-Ditylum_brightwellii.AAC.1